MEYMPCRYPSSQQAKDCRKKRFPWKLLDKRKDIKVIKLQTCFDAPRFASLVRQRLGAPEAMMEERLASADRSTKCPVAVH